MHFETAYAESQNPNVQLKKTSRPSIRLFYVIAGFLREEAENVACLGYYAASSGNFLPTFRDNLLFC